MRPRYGQNCLLKMFTKLHITEELQTNNKKNSHFMEMLEAGYTSKFSS